MAQDIVTLGGNIIIPPKNRMQGKIKIEPLKNSIGGSLYVYSETVVQEITYPPRMGNQRKAHLTVPERNNLTSSITVRIKNKMAGSVSIIEPPSYTFELPSSKDAFIRDKAKTLNYGQDGSMAVGRNASTGEIYRSLVGFDLSKLPDNIKIESVKMRLYNFAVRDSDQELQVYSSANNWPENGVTWLNQPATRDYVGKLTTGSKEEFVDVDVTQTVKEWISGSKTNYGFILKKLNETIGNYAEFRTRESQQNVPTLVFTYKYNINYSVGMITVPAHIYVMSVGKKDVSGHITIPGTDDVRNLKANLTVLRPDMMISHILVNKRTIYSSLTVRQKDSKSLISRLTIRVQAGDGPDENLSSNILISRSHVDSHINIKHRKNLLSNLIVRSQGKKDLNASLGVTRLSIPSNLTVQQKDQSQINGSINVQQNKQSDLISNIIIIKGYVNSKIVIPERDSLAANIIVRQKSKTELTSSLSIRREYLRGRIIINSRHNLPSTITVQRTDINQIPSSITVIREYLQGSIYVRENASNDFMSNLVVRQKKEENFPSSLNISRYWINANIKIKEQGSSDLSGSIRIQQKDNDDHSSSISVIRRTIEATIRVRQLGNNDLASNLIVRQKDQNSIQAKIKIPYRSKIQGHMFLVHTSTLNASVRVNKPILYGHVRITERGFKNLRSTIRVRVRAVSEITCSITINADDDSGFVFII